MKNKLFLAIMMMATLLFIATGASAQYCSSFLPSCHWQETLGNRLQEENHELAEASVVQGGIQEFVPAVPATEEDKDEMVAAGAARVTGLKDAHENAAQFGTGRELCGYCSVFERAGFP